MDDCVQVARIRIVFLGLREVVTAIKIVVEQVKH
jgi:hypothetical protein